MESDKLAPARGCLNAIIITTLSILGGIFLHTVFKLLTGTGMSASTVLTGAGVVILLVLAVGVFRGKPEIDGEK